VVEARVGAPRPTVPLTTHTDGSLPYLQNFASAGQSWGQKMMGTRIIDAETGANISIGRAFGRLLFRTFISPILCWLGFLWMLWDGRKQTWHDKAVNTIVIKA
jgi:uncharacterized RDD family membrane protein YckC